MYEFFLALLVTSADNPEGSEVEYVFEFGAEDAEDDEEAIIYADWTLEEYLGSVGFDSLVGDGLTEPLIWDYMRADLYQNHRKVADLTTGLFDLGESPSLIKKYEGRSLPRHLNDILGQPKYG